MSGFLAKRGKCWAGGGGGVSVSNWFSCASVYGQGGWLHTVCWLSDEVDCPSLSWSFLLLVGVWKGNKRSSKCFHTTELAAIL